MAYCWKKEREALIRHTKSQIRLKEYSWSHGLCSRYCHIVLHGTTRQSCFFELGQLHPLLHSLTYFLYPSWISPLSHPDVDEFRVVPSYRVWLCIPLTEASGELQEEGAVLTKASPAQRAADMMDCRRKSPSHLRMRSWRFAWIIPIII